MSKFDSGTAYAESDADDEYALSPVDDESEHSPIDSEMISSQEHTPTTYGYRNSADRLPETIISEWTADECADFISAIGLPQYSDRFIGWFLFLQAGVPAREILLSTAHAMLTWAFSSIRERYCWRSIGGPAA